MAWQLCPDLPGCQPPSRAACGDNDAGPCCEASDTPYCRDWVCCNAVCDIDPYCCEGEWNECCAELANEICSGPMDEPSPCIGHCGMQSPVGCWCDPFCCNFQDCCSDKAGVCGGCGPVGGVCSVGTCQGYCGEQGSWFCSCDELCSTGGPPSPEKCCPDKCEFCFCEPPFFTSCESSNGCGSHASGCSCSDTCIIGETCCADICQACGTHPDCNPADITGDNIVNGFDLLELLAGWGLCPTFGEHCPDPNECPADVNGDSVVNGFDVLFLLANWGGVPLACGSESCCQPGATPGCTNADCCSIICETLPSCCTVAWTAQCATRANFFCPACGGTPPR